MEVTNRDLYEFNLWIKSKSKSTPRLREQFKSDSEYEDYMTEYQESHKDKVFSGVSEGAAVINSGMSYGKENEEFSEREKVSKEMLEKAKEEGVIQKYSTNLWGIISLKSGEWWDSKYDTREKAEAALKAYQANKNFSEEGWCVLERWADSNGHDLKKPKYIACKGDRSNVVDSEVERVVKTNLTRKEAQELRDKLQFKQKSFSMFSWEPVPETPGHSLDEVIGSVMYSITYCHFYHLCTSSYARHMALDAYYKEMPELIDKLAEMYLEGNSEAKFRNAVLPGIDSVAYLNDLLELIDAYTSDVDSGLPSEFISALDDVKSLIRSTMYKLKRLDSGQKVFSIK